MQLAWAQEWCFRRTAWHESVDFQWIVLAVNVINFVARSGSEYLSFSSEGSGWCHSIRGTTIRSSRDGRMCHLSMIRKYFECVGSGCRSPVAEQMTQNVPLNGPCAGCGSEMRRLSERRGHNGKTGGHADISSLRVRHSKRVANSVPWYNRESHQ